MICHKNSVIGNHDKGRINVESCDFAEGVNHVVNFNGNDAIFLIKGTPADGFEVIDTFGETVGDAHLETTRPVCSPAHPLNILCAFNRRPAVQA